MANDKTPDAKKTPLRVPKAGKQVGPSQSIQAPIVPAPVPTRTTATRRRSNGSKKGSGNRPRVGGTAVQGAKSTLPRSAPPGNDANAQQAESYNRTMRRRMEQMGTGPQGQEQRVETLQQQRQKRKERRKERIEERRAELRKSMPGGAGRFALGRRNTYFIIAVAAIVILLIVLVLVLRYFHVLGVGETARPRGCVPTLTC